MLIAKALCEILTSYSDSKVCREWFLMMENGTVLAYSDSANVGSVPKLAARAISSWKAQLSASEDNDNHYHEHGEPVESSEKQLKPEADFKYLETLTLEMNTSNMIISKIRPDLLLVLNGNPPPRGEDFKPREGATWRFAASSNKHDGKAQFGSERALSNPSRVDSTSDTFAENVLEFQKQRVDTVARELSKALDEGGFDTPDQSVNKTL